MDTQTPLPEDWTRPLVERQLRMLDQLAEAGLEIALALRDQAVGKAEAPVVAAGDVALAYGRVSRAVRMTLALQSKIITGLQAQEAAAAEERFQEEQFRKGQVEAAVERIIRAEHEGESEEAVEALLDTLIVEAGERLDDHDAYGDVMLRPIQDMVAQICRDLGLPTTLNATSPVKRQRNGGGGPRSGGGGVRTQTACDTQKKLNGLRGGTPPPPPTVVPLPRFAGEVAS